MTVFLNRNDTFQKAFHNLGPRSLRSWLNVKEPTGCILKTPFIIEKHLGHEVHIDRPLTGPLNTFCKVLDPLLCNLSKDDIANLVLCKRTICRFADQTSESQELCAKINKILAQINSCPLFTLPKDVVKYFILDKMLIRTMRKVSVQCRDQLPFDY